MAALLIPLGFQPQDGNGKPRPGAKMYVYTAGTTTPVTVYDDNALSSAHSSPIVADSNGVFPAVYCNPGSYKIKIDNSADVQFLLQDDYAAPIPSDNGTVAVANGGTGATSASVARTNLGAASASDVTTLSTDVADVKGQVDGLPGGALGDIAALDEVRYTDLADIDRIVLQRVLVTDSTETAYASAATIPGDDTIPQVSEGVELFSQSFTPVDADSIIEIRVQSTIMLSGQTYGCIAVFQSGSTNAIAVAPFQNTLANRASTYTVVARHEPGSTSAFTISVRAGATVSQTLTVNGSNYGSAITSFMEILEYQDAPIT